MLQTQPCASKWWVLKLFTQNAFHKYAHGFAVHCFVVSVSSMHSDRFNTFRCKTAVTRLLTHWSYCSHALSHRFILIYSHEGWFHRHWDNLLCLSQYQRVTYRVCVNQLVPNHESQHQAQPKCPGLGIHLMQSTNMFGYDILITMHVYIDMLYIYIHMSWDRWKKENLK